MEERKALTVELLIPVYRPGEELKRLLGRMARQTYPLSGVRLLITASVRDYPIQERQCQKIWEDLGRGEIPLHMVRIDPKDFDHGGTRHLGAGASQADLLLFMTQDAVPENTDLVKTLVQAFDGRERKRPLAAVYARQLPREDCHLIEKITRDFNYPDQSRIKTREDLKSLGIKTYFCSNVCAMYDKKIYEALGGFPRHTIFNEDMIFAAGAIQAGYAIGYEAKARVIHSHNYSAMEQLHRNFDLAVSQADHEEIFASVPSEGEGIRMIRSAMGILWKSGKGYLIPKLIWQSGFKYMGYLLGKRYRKLPKWMIQKMTMNPRYWE